MRTKEDNLRWRRYSLKLRARNVLDEMFLVRQELERLIAKHYKIKGEYKKNDRELAMLDGRYHLLPPIGSVQKKEVPIGELLTMLDRDQLQKIINVLEE